MSKHSLCANEAEREKLLLDAQQMAFWAAAPITPGDSIGAQINKAATELRLERSVVWRAWYLRSGPCIHETIRRAYERMLERRAWAEPRYKEIKPRYFGERAA
jgi:hypothetical protein